MKKMRKCRKGSYASFFVFDIQVLPFSFNCICKTVCTVIADIIFYWVIVGVVYKTFADKNRIRGFDIQFFCYFFSCQAGRNLFFTGFYGYLILLFQQLI